MTDAPRPRLVVEGGRTAFRVGDALEPAHFYVCPDPDPKRVKRFARLGVRGVSFSTTANLHPYALVPPTVDAAGRRDFREFDARCRRILGANPAALLLPRVHVSSTAAWDDAHESELTVWENGTTSLGFSEDGYSKRGAASFSSRVWRRAAADDLRALLEHARDADYGRAIVGVVVCGGRTEEWFHLGSVRDVLCDFGPAATAAFRAWLAVRPAEERDRALRALEVDDPAAAAVPSAARRRGVVGPSRFLDPVAHADVIAYEAFFAEEIADVVAELCGVVRDVSNGAWAAGAFYGYLVEMACHGPAMRHGGHLALRKLLADPRVDFLCSPTSYVRREPRTGASFSMLPTETVLASGKAFFHENDVRTFLLWKDAGYGRADTAAESAEQLRREARFAVDHGLGLWWFDMVGGFYDHPALEAEVEAGVAAARRAMGPGPQVLPRATPRLAFVVDEDSLRTTDLWGDWYADVLPRQLAELHRLGEPVGVWLLDDFFRFLAVGRTASDATPHPSSVDAMSRFDLLVLPNLFRVEASTLDRLRAALEAGVARRTLFVGPCGMAPTLTGPGPGPAVVTGLPLTVVPGSTQVFVRVPDPQGGPDLEFGGGRWWPWHLRNECATAQEIRRHISADDSAWYFGGPVPSAALPQ